MALFNKLFSSNKRKNINAPTAQHSTSNEFPFSNEQVRILLFRECDWRGRRMLFDSSAIQRVHLASNSSNIGNGSGGGYNGKKNSNTGFVEICDGFGYKYSRPNGDYTSIGEMVFGAVAMSFRGTSLKVHWLQSPSRILCSEVFLSPVQTNTFFQHSSSEHTGSDVSSVDTSSLNSFSLSFSLCVSDNLNSLGEKYRTNPLDVPSSIDITDNRLLSHSAGDSGYSGGTTDPWNTSISSCCPYSSTRSSFGSVYSDQESLRKLSIDSSIPDGSCSHKTSDGSLQRRVLRNVSTSFENRQSMSDFIGYIGDNHPSTNTVGGSDSCVSKWRRNSEVAENRSNPEIQRRKTTSGDAIANNLPNPGSSRSHGGSGRRARLGLAVCITLSESVENDMKSFCSEHIVLFESMLCRLRATAENAYINKQNFLQIMLKAWHSTSQWVSDLFTAPRLVNPIWLTLSSGNAKHPGTLANSFMNELCCLLTCADTKDTNFFISTLLTAILTHHLGWVGTVAPLSSRINNSTRETASAVSEQQAKMSEISKTYPYNALWAQMGDLYGAIGNPPKISKTIICGSQTLTVDKVLNVLTYFIRCGEIKKEFRDKIIEKNTINDIMNNMEKHTISGEEIDEMMCERMKSEGSTELCNTWGSRCSHVKDNFLNNRCDESVNVRTDENVSMKMNGLTRSASHVKELSCLGNNSSTEKDNVSTTSVEAINNKKMQDLVKMLQKNVMNDIPNVLVYRDSRFVKQELRIGNHLMDTGIEMNPKFKRDVRPYQVKNSKERIKLMITSPDNVEFSVTSHVDVDHSNKLDRVDEAIEEQENLSNCSYNSINGRSLNGGAIKKTSISHINDDNDSMKSNKNLSDLITASSLGVVDKNVKLLWGIETVKDGYNMEPLHNIEKGIEIDENHSMMNGHQRYDHDEDTDGDDNDSIDSNTTLNDFNRSKSMFAKSSNVKNTTHIRRSKLVRKRSVPKIEPIEINNHDDHEEDLDKNISNLNGCKSLSDLITENSFGQTDRFIWGIEPGKGDFSLEQLKNLELDEYLKFHQSEAKCRKSNDGTEKQNGVVFVLGDNEALVGIKNSNSNNNHQTSVLVKKQLNGDEAQFSGRNNQDQVASSSSSLSIPNSSASNFVSTSALGNDIVNLTQQQSSVNGIIGKQQQDIVDGQQHHYHYHHHDHLLHLHHHHHHHHHHLHHEQLNGLQEQERQSTSLIASSSSQQKQINNDSSSCEATTRKICNHKYKKHSGVKFNFEQYPQIAKNYMRNKNLDLTDMNFLEKAIKMEREMKNASCGASTSSLVSVNSTTSTSKNNNNNCDVDNNDDENECECCAGAGSLFLQTPSNASELEFSSEDNSYNTLPSTSAGILSSILPLSSAAVATSKCMTGFNDSRENHLLTVREEGASCLEKTLNEQQQIQKLFEQKYQQEQLRNKSNIKIISLPIPKSVERSFPIQQNSPPKIEKFNKQDDGIKPTSQLTKSGFVPSLLTGVSDHYISDMVLQGTFAPLNKWEGSLKQDLTLAAHCATLEQLPTENVAIVANTDKWDVSVVSSQNYMMPSGNGPVGMSQLVSSMLETVQAMWGAGTPAYQCMSFIESKLQEMYLQSETLAAFLLATEFCSLNTVTSALNLSDNDVPLLLSVASIHSPQVTKKYGVSFR